MQEYGFLYFFTLLPNKNAGCLYQKAVVCVLKPTLFNVKFAFKWHYFSVLQKNAAFFKQHTTVLCTFISKFRKQ
ncbi:hypothetical protein C7N43_32665 [Sphingobacteriales bacterium UPWRP_1]|nr:hypothetical protein B6N25_11310 [Sphingobacteriales bacterium TSM_CSS]PSJ72752.1 hypothetical protein C7N43_32665 [Sphingobacteriales bacterium UPWRP_1]